MRTLALPTILIASFLVVLPASAHAQYLDPGSSSVLVQVLLGGLVGVAAVFKLYWHKIRGLVGSSKSSPRDGT